MSTRCTLAYGPKFHLYNECLDNDNVYLELEGAELEMDHGAVVLTIPIEIWEVIRAYGAPDLSLVNKSDEELAGLARDYVEDRMRRVREFESAHPERNSGIIKEMGIGVYGSADDPAEEQIARGAEHYKHERARQQRIRDAIESLKSQQRR